MDENLNNSNEVVNENESKKKWLLSKWQVVAFIAVLLIVMCGVLFASSSSITAKKLYVGLLENARDKIAVAETVTFKNTNAGFYTSEQKYSTKYSQEYLNELSDFMKEYLKDSSSESSQKVYFDKKAGKFYVSNTNNGETTQYLVDEKTQIVYYLDKDNNLSQSKLDKKSINTLKSKTDILEDDTNNRISYLVLDKLIKNMKNSYFRDAKKDGINEYTISLSKNDIKELALNTFNDLIKDKEFKEYAIQEMNIAEEDYDSKMKEAVDELKEKFDEINNLKFELSIFVKGLKIDKLSMIKADIQVEDTILQFELKGEDAKVLSESKVFKGKMLAKSDKQEVSFDITLTLSDSKIGLEGSISADSGYGSKESVSMNLVLQTADNKTFDKSGNIELVFSAEAEGEKHEIKAVLASDDNVSFDKAAKIELSAYVDGQKYDKSFVVESKDKKEMSKSSEIELSVKTNGVSDGSFIVRANDNKAILESSEVELSMKTNVETKLLLVTALDKKKIKESSHLKFSSYSTFGTEADTYTIKANDNKPFNKSSNLEISATSNGESYNIKIKATDGKSFIETSGIELSGDYEGVTFNGYIKSKDRKPLKAASGYIGSIKAEGDGKYLKGSINGSEMEYEVKNEYSNNMYSSSSSVLCKFKEEKKIDFNKLMNTKNAKEITEDEMKEKLGIKYSSIYDYLNSMQSSLDSLQSSYGDDYNYDFDYDYDYDYDDIYDTEILPVYDY